MLSCFHCALLCVDARWLVLVRPKVDLLDLITTTYQIPNTVPNTQYPIPNTKYGRRVGHAAAISTFIKTSPKGHQKVVKSRAREDGNEPVLF